MLPSLFAKLATCVDPFIYTLNQPRIRKEILRRLHLLPPAPINPSVPGENLYYCNNPTDFPNSRRSNNCNDNNNSSHRIGSQQQQIADRYHRRSITTSNNTQRAHQPCSSLVGRVIIEENIIGPVRITNADRPNDLRESVFNNLSAGDDIVSPNQS